MRAHESGFSPQTPVENFPAVESREVSSANFLVASNPKTILLVFLYHDQHITN